MYGGDLLPGSYDDWVLAERDRLRVAATDALVRLAHESAERGDDARALEYGRELLRLDALREDGYRIVMGAHARRGERVEAIRAYHRCVEVLERELGVEPDRVTTALYEAIRSGGALEVGGPALPAPVEHRLPVVTSSPLIGRDREWQSVLEEWRAATGGQARLLLVTGEPGIGKSRLVDELARFVAGEGHAVARARAYQSAGRLPWGPVLDWLRSDAVHPRLDTLGAPHRAELARILPELRTGLALPIETFANPDAARHELFDAIAAVLVDAEHATLLVLDDIQWCDPDSLELLAFLVGRASIAPLLVAATARQEEIDESHELTPIAAGLARDGLVTELPLDPLDEAATADLAARPAGTEIDVESAAQLWRETEGNPLFVLEAMRAGPPDPGRTTTLSPTVQAVISGRLAQLSPDARRPRPGCRHRRPGVSRRRARRGDGLGGGRSRRGTRRALAPTHHPGAAHRLRLHPRSASAGRARQHQSGPPPPPAPRGRGCTGGGSW